ncbi:serine hydrolase domain-containing protein [Rhodococcus opacus]|uniref:serine hydrolase domain-containing protein n=1 Tax=Rhodococcus opacus TaxID=37919 RepID=UPI001C43D89B|nr:serine hydrolase domain-containing protein [Rhodococcus opacus]MBV6760420.1 beta-lactamase family protein [Rhodococcus opacus]
MPQSIDELESVPLTADPDAAGLDPVALGRLTDAIRHDIDRGLHLGATVLVARGGVVGYHQAIGMADPSTARDSRLDDLYFLMSVTKSFTAVAVLQLIERGQLSLDTRVAEIIPEYAQRGKQHITVYHLLTHTAGAYSGFSLPTGMQWEDQGNLDLTTRFLTPLPALHRPGARVVYSPWEGFAILAEVVRRLDPQQRAFRELLRDEIFSPLGMSSSSMGAPVDHPRRVPVKVVNPGGAAQAASQMESLNNTGTDFELAGGSGYSTTSDLFRFADALRRGGANEHGRVLSRATTEYAFRNHTGDKINEFWDFNKEAADLPDFPANFTLGGGYARGDGHHLTPVGQTASASSFCAVGSGTTSWMVDPERELTVVFLSSGLVEGLRHFQRLQRINDLALSAVL